MTNPAASNPPDASSGAFASLQPGYIADQFPGGVPQATPATVGGVPSVTASQVFGPQGGGTQQNTGSPQYQQMSTQLQALMAQTAQMTPDQLNSPQGQALQQQIGQVQQQLSTISPGQSVATGNGTPGVQTPVITGIPKVSSQQVTNPQSIVSQMGGAQTYSPDAAISAAQNYLQPQFQQQDNALTEALANAGIVGGSTGKALSDLGSQQQTTLANQIQPYILQNRQLQQSATTQDNANSIQTSIANQVADLQAQGMDQATALQTATTNAANQLQAQGYNSTMAYQLASQNAQLSQQAQLANQSTALQGGEFNASNQNAGQQFNISNLLNTANTDTNSYNQFLQYLAGLQNQDWMSQLGATTSAATAGLGATTNAFQPVYSQPSATNVGGLASAFAPQGGGAAASTPNLGYTSPTISGGGSGSSAYLNPDTFG